MSTRHPQSSLHDLPDIEAVSDWPQQAALEENWPEAARRWVVLRYAYPHNEAPWIWGATAYLEAGDLQRAAILFGEAREQFPDNPYIYIQLADIAMRQHNWDNAGALLEEARERFPENESVWTKSAMFAENRGDLEQAETYNQEAQRRFPGSIMPLLQFAELSMRAERWDEALERWKQLRTRFPKDPRGYFRAADAARQKGDKREARRLLLAYEYGDDAFGVEETPAAKPRARGQAHKKLDRRLLELIWTKAIFNLRSEVHHNYLSYGWWVLEPLLHMLVYYVVFAFLLQGGGEHYLVFLITGLIPWMWFSKVVSTSSTSILFGHHLMTQVGLPAVVFPLVSMLQASVKELPAFILLFVFVWLQGFPPSATWWALVPVILVNVLLMMSIAGIVAAVIPFMRDLNYLVPTGLTFLMFLSGIFYDYRAIPEAWQAGFLLNPVAFLLKCYREIFMDNVLPDMQTLLFWGIGSAITCLLVLLAYKHLRYIYPRIVME